MLHYTKRGKIGHGASVHALALVPGVIRGPIKNNTYVIYTACGANLCSTGFRRGSPITQMPSKTVVTCQRCLKALKAREPREWEFERKQQESYWDSFVD